MKTPEYDMNATLERVPDHVPPGLVHEMDFIHSEVDDPFEYWKQFDRQKIPDIFYTRYNGGHWVMRRVEDIRAIMRNKDNVFHNFPTGLPVEPGRPAVIPLEIDPPEHRKYRAVLAPMFTPKAIKQYEARIREVAGELIDRVLAKGRCDFVAEIARRIPTALFLEFMGMPVERLSEFMVWEEESQRGTPDKSQAAMQNIVAYLDRFFEAQAKSPGNNVTGAVLKARDKDGNPWSPEELMSVGYMLFAAGLDTVTGTMGFIWRYLARNPAAREYIRANMDDPLKMSFIFEELIRTHTMTTDTRRVREDTVYKGVHLKKGDVIVLPLPMGNYDPALVDNPETVDLTRKVNPHIAFGTGQHRCLGSLLARGEIVICLQEWLKRIPDFEIEPGAKIRCWVRVMAGMDTLPLVWRTI
jgi:cytochrome P450